MAFTIVGDAAIVQGGTDKTRKAAVFTGGNTDDYYQTDALAAARVAANDTVGTITAWVMPGDKTSTMTAVGFGDKDVVEFIELNVEAGKVAARCTDATTAAWVVVTSAAVLNPHEWAHIAVVQDAVKPVLYVNGVAVAQTASTTTALTKWFDDCAGIDSGRIGAANKAGDDSVTQEFVGGISDVKYYNTALTSNNIMNDYLNGHLTTGCIAWYTMLDLTDAATGGGTYDLTAVSDVYMTPSYNEFISKVRKFGALAADTVGLAECNGRLTALFINAA